jgi:hypothetical protein
VVHHDGGQIGLQLVPTRRSQPPQQHPRRRSVTELVETQVGQPLQDVALNSGRTQRIPQQPAQGGGCIVGSASLLQSNTRLMADSPHFLGGSV